MTYYEEATIHGVSKIYNTESKFKKLVWILVLLLFFILFGIFLHRILTLYYKHEMKVTTTYKISNEKMDFPIVTLCNSNRVISTRLFGLYAEMNPNATNVSLDGITEFAEGLTEDDSKVLSQQYDEFFVTGCTFNNQVCKGTIQENFHLYPGIINGNCFVFNFNRSELQLKPGYKYGLHVVVDIDQDSYLSYDFDQSLKPAGVLVTLQNEFSQPDMNHAILASPNQLTKISVMKSSITRLEAPFPDKCRHKSDESNDQFPMLLEVSYTQKLCYESCYIFKMNETCGVLDFESFLLVKLTNYSFAVAETTTETQCIASFNERFDNRQVQCQCPPPCYEELFPYSTNNALWPAKIAEESWIKKASSSKRKNITKNYIRENFVAIQIFYETFKTMETVHTRSYSFDYLVADLGGVLGLWIGASIFSIIELMVFLLELSSRSIYKLAGKVKVDTTN